MSTLPSGSGVVFPDDGKSFEQRSTTKSAKKILAASLEGHAGAEKLSKAKDSAWRFGYQPHVRDVIHAMADQKNTVAVAGAGLKAVHDSFNFHREGSGEMPMVKAMKVGTFPDTFRTGVVSGAPAVAGAGNFAASVPYKNESYTGAALAKLAKLFSSSGEAEPSFADSVEEVASSPSALTPPKDSVFVLIGATSEMGPCEALLKGGATVVALARKAGRGGAKRWEELCASARASPGGNLICPVGVSAKGEVADGFSPADVGADALAHTPEIVNWLVELFTTHPLCMGKRPLIYSGIYLDGGKFVRASVAMEFIIHELTERLVGLSSPSLLYIDTPSHVHLLPTEVAKNPVYSSSAPWWLKLLGSVGLIKSSPQKKASNTNGEYTVCDFTSLQQGPNYAVAKLIQRWRAVWSRHAGASLYNSSEKRDKQLVSITTGPAAKTESVMHSKTMAVMVENVHRCPPNVAHEPETVRALMTLVMLRDLRSNKALGNPNVDAAGGKPAHPMAFLVENAWHGGPWRCPYSLDSAGPYVVVIALYGKVIMTGLLAVGGLAVYGGLRWTKML